MRSWSNLWVSVERIIDSGIFRRGCGRNGGFGGVSEHFHPLRVCGLVEMVPLAKVCVLTAERAVVLDWKVVLVQVIQIEEFLGRVAGRKDPGAPDCRPWVESDLATGMAHLHPGTYMKSAPIPSPFLPPVIRTGIVLLRPSLGIQPWFARALSPGHGPRTSPFFGARKAWPEGAGMALPNAAHAASANASRPSMM